MGRRLLILALLLLVVTACVETEPPELAATREGQRVDMEVQATRQYLSEQATREAVAVGATEQAVTVAGNATATAVAIASNGEERRQALERDLATVKAWGMVAATVLLVLAIGVIGWRFATVYLDRARLVQLDVDRGEPVLVIGKERFALPLRSFNPYADLTHGDERAPALAAPEDQERTTSRQQATNLLQARQTGDVAHARRGKAERVVIVRDEREGGQIRNGESPEPGLLGVSQAPQLEDATEAGLLPPPLADAIETQWREVDDA
jgi:hypothetical protein